MFKYENAQYPNILFCADSNFKFLEPEDTIQLKDNSISTVAHHGSKENSETFELIDGKNVIYVRSDSKNNHRPSKEYISLQNRKYCTICNLEPNSKDSKHIILCYRQNTWCSSNQKCSMSIKNGV